MKAGNTLFSNKNARLSKFDRSKWILIITVALSCGFTSMNFFMLSFTGSEVTSTDNVKLQRHNILEQCGYIKRPAGPDASFSTRTQSDRFVPGTKSVLLRNGKIWTGARNGTEMIFGDIFLDKGIIKAIGYIPPDLLETNNYELHDVNGAWITPGIVDLHSHIGVDSSPELKGASDGNSRKAPILPWLRSIDGLNTHDASYELAIAGGVTTAQILPGSANNIGGQAYVIKLRTTEERSVTSKVIEPPYTLNGSNFDHSLTPRWRHMKHACGENPSRVYSMTRMDSGWNFRNAYNEAKKIKDAQDEFCEKAEKGYWQDLGEFPESLQWEALVDVLRGKVKLAVHCYEAVDLDFIVRLTNEFEFPVASFHHAGETYLVPDLLKKTWGGTPSIALFASNFRKKREAYRGSEFAPRVLAEHGIPVVMKSDHPVLNSRYLMYEAQQAHFYGLKPALALAAVTSTPANAAGLGHRIGSLKEGYDAGEYVVVWDSHPLALGATPIQVYIDGIPQLVNPHVSPKPKSFQELPKTPNFDKEAADTVKYEGLPPLRSRRVKNTLFKNVTNIFIKKTDGAISKIVRIQPDLSSIQDGTTVLVANGEINCVGNIESDCFKLAKTGENWHEITEVDLEGGSLLPALTSFGSPLGLVEIRQESSTNDGVVYDALTSDIPSILGGDRAIIRAVDGLQFGGRNTLLSYISGVSTAVTAPVGAGLLLGISAAFHTGAHHALEKAAIVQNHVAMHVAVNRYSTASVSTQIATLRRLLYGSQDGSRLTKSEEYHYDYSFDDVRQGAIPLVVHVDDADIMATLLKLKQIYESDTGKHLRLTFAGATEAHLLASELGKTDVSVILSPSRPFPSTWEKRRILPGPPLTSQSAIMKLLHHGVNVAIGAVDEYNARNSRFDIAWAALESNGYIDAVQAIALASTNLERALGLEPTATNDIVAYQGGGVLDFESKVVAIVSPKREQVDIFVD